MWNKKNRSEPFAEALKQYFTRRNLEPPVKTELTLTEFATMQVVQKELSNRNVISYSLDKVDPVAAESQYIKLRTWVSESAEEWRLELAQLLYPVFIHIYILLVVTQPDPAVAQRFHKRHQNTFQSNPEFKLFIQQLGDATTAGDLEQNPAISTFRSARYCVTLRPPAYTNLLRYLESTISNVILHIVSQDVELNIGDPLAVGSRQDIRASLQYEQAQSEKSEEDESDRVKDLIKVVHEGPPTGPSIAMYRINSDLGVCLSGETDVDGELLIAGCDDNQVRMWDLLPREEPDSLDVHSSTVQLAGGSEPIVSTLGLPGKPRLLKGHTGSVYDAILLPGGRSIVSCGEDTTVRLWDRYTSTPLTLLQGHLYPVWCAAADRIGLNFATGSMDNTARLWRTEVTYPLRIYAGHEQSVDCLSFHPNCNYLLTGSRDRTVRMWSVPDGRCVRVLVGHKAPVTTVQVSPSGKYAASGGEDRKVKIWDMAQNKCIKELKGHADTVNCLVWGDNRLLCTGSMDGTVRVWDIGTAESESMGCYSAGGTVIGVNMTSSNTVIVTAQQSPEL